jgi:hypothetical protein
MAIAIKTLGAGTIPISQGNVGSAVATGKTYLVKNIILYNNGPSPLTITFWYQHSPDPVRMTYSAVIPANSRQVYEPEFTMVAGDQLKGACGAGGTVYYMINGIERDA